jgi:septum formation protein
MTPMPFLVLASASPRRRALLAELGLPFEVIVSDASEELVAGVDPEAQAIALAERKARAVAADQEQRLVLGADTIVVLDGEILGKPVDDADAISMLQRLSGREHHVITGVVLLDVTNQLTRASAVRSTVRLRSLSDEEISVYVITGEPRDKAGTYAIQGLGARLIEHSCGCYTNIVGLPLCEVVELLTAAGVVIPPDFAGCRLPDGSPCPRTV